MLNKTRQKINQLRSEPEEQRQQRASRYLIVALVIAAIIWIVILLPIQLILNNTRRPDSDALNIYQYINNFPESDKK